MENVILTIVLAVLGSTGVSSIVVACLNRYWSKRDKLNTKLDALVEANQALMIDRIRWLGKAYIKSGFIRIEDKENLLAMYLAYKGLGGNGHLDTIMNEVSHLEVHG